MYRNIISKVYQKLKSPGMDEQLSFGKEIEKEHKDTITEIAKKLKPEITNEELETILELGYTLIAKDHLKEFEDYYIPNLKEMEDKLEKQK